MASIYKNTTNPFLIKGKKYCDVSYNCPFYKSQSFFNQGKVRTFFYNLLYDLTSQSFFNQGKVARRPAEFHRDFTSQSFFNQGKG